jgi:hypothetical protein
MTTIDEWQQELTSMNMAKCIQIARVMSANLTHLTKCTMHKDKGRKDVIDMLKKL